MPVRPRSAKARPVAKTTSAGAKTQPKSKSAKAKTPRPKAKPSKSRPKPKPVKAKPLPPASTIGANPLDAPVARAAVIAAIFGPASTKLRGKRRR